MSESVSQAPSASALGDQLGFWARFRLTFGPALVGLLGGGLTVGLTLVSVTQLLTNCSYTYAAFPSLQPPFLVRDLSLPAIVLVPLVVLAVVAPFGMGLATAWLVRGRDRWSEVSAGLTTGLVGSAAAYVAGLGWAVTLALVVVPSVADLTLLGDATKTPVAAAPPSDVLTERYPDLKAKPADERGGVFFAKVVADQVVGSAYGVWLGVALSLATVGALGFCGTLAGGWLLRRGGSWKSIVIPYFELTVATSLAAGRLVAAPLGLGSETTWFDAVCLVLATVFVVLGVIGRFGWLLRVTLAVTWALVFCGAGFTERTSVTLSEVAPLAYCAAVVLLARQWWLSERQPTATPA